MQGTEGSNARSGALLVFVIQTIDRESEMQCKAQKPLVLRGQRSRKTDGSRARQCLHTSESNERKTAWQGGCFSARDGSICEIRTSCERGLFEQAKDHLAQT
eukprot:jgi/Antlo1/306/1597